MRAYKLIEIKSAEEPTFNASQDDTIYWLGNNNENGFISYDRETIEDVIKIESKHKDSSNYTERDFLILDNILKDMGEDDVVEYYCY